VFLSLFALVPLTTAAQDWPQFRGPQRDGTSAANLPTTWSATTNMAWKVKLPGPGASSPIVVGNKVILTCYTGYGLREGGSGEMSNLERMVLCYDLASGKELWSFKSKANQPEQPFQGFQALHGYASSTPASDGEFVYVFFGRSGVGALTLDGKAKWAQKVGEGTHNWGSGTSPLLYKDLVIVNAQVEGSGLVALNKKTGQKVWSQPSAKSAWNSPFLVRASSGEDELVISSKGQVQAYEPATGKPLWQSSGVQDYVCPSIISFDGKVFAIGARSSMGVLIEAGGRGDVTPIWEVNKGSNVSSPVYHDGYLYWAHESRGVAYCVDAKTGEVKYEERLEPRPDRIYASPIVAGGKIYYVSRNNGVFIVAARPQFELLSHVPPLDNSTFNGSPAVGGGKLLLRSNEYLYAVGE
jgi:outer membrane protein assembly factor BamB